MGKDIGNKKKSFDEGRTYLVRGATLNALWEAVHKSKPIAGANTKVRETHDGWAVDAEAGGEFPKHPWEIYRLGEGWAVWPASVQGTEMPTIGGVPLDDSDPPVVVPDGAGNVGFWLKFNMDGESAEGVGGIYRLVSGSQSISGVVVSTSPGSTTEVSCDPSTGEVTPGHYVFEIGSVALGRKVAQEMRFSVSFTLCGGGGVTPQAYG